MKTILLKPFFATIVFFIGIFSLLGTQLFLVQTYYSKLGIEYDEVLSINAGSFCSLHSSLFLENVILRNELNGFCIPIMLSPYIGAPTALPMMLFYHSNMQGIYQYRLLNSLLTYASLLLFIYPFWKNRVFSKKESILFFVLLLFDPLLFMNHLSDRTVVVPLLLRALFVYIFLQKQKKFVPVLFSGIVLGVFLWAKSDGFFLITSFFISTFALHSVQYFIRTTRIRIFLLGLFVGLAPFIFYLRTNLSSIISSFQSVAAPTFSIAEKSKKILFFFSPTDHFRYIFQDICVVTLTYIDLFSIVLFACYLFVISLLVQKGSKIHQTFALMSIVYLLFFFFVSKMGSIHHRLLLFPLPQALLILGLRYISREKRTTIITSVLLSQISLQLLTLITLQEVFSYSCGKRSFDCTIYNLEEKIRAYPGPIYVNDWGITTQLLFLTKKPIHDISFSTNELESSEKITIDTFPMTFLFIQHTKEHTYFENSRTFSEDLQNKARCDIHILENKYEVLTCTKE